MLCTLTIHEVRLVKFLHLEFSRGLSIVSGETGAGKTILLEALSLALGERAQVSFIRKNASQGSVSVCFSLPSDHEVWALLVEQGLACAPEDFLVLRRIISREPPLSRAFIQDQSVSLAFLKRVSGTLVDIHGQFERWLTRRHQTALLDRYGRLTSLQKKVQQAYKIWDAKEHELQKFQQEVKNTQSQDTFLLHSLEELDSFDPRTDEEESLLEQRQQLSSKGRLLSELQSAHTSLTGSQGVRAVLSQVGRHLQKAIFILGASGSSLEEALDRSFAEIEELTRLMEDVLERHTFPSFSLEALEERLSQLRSIARKHGVNPKELPQLKEKLRLQVEDLENFEERCKAFAQEVAHFKEIYLQHATLLQEGRVEASKKLEEKIREELAPLRLEKAQFIVQPLRLEEKDYGPQGIDTLEFYIITNPGEAPAPLQEAASGGELSRFLLALKVSLAGSFSFSTLIFDEIDTGTGGAVAEAIGLRLKQISSYVQILAITHSPQVAAQADHHWKVIKENSENDTLITVKLLSEEEHLEEVARMLSGAKITSSARAAALQLKNSSSS